MQKNPGWRQVLFCLVAGVPAVVAIGCSGDGGVATSVQGIQADSLGAGGESYIGCSTFDSNPSPIQMTTFQNGQLIGGAPYDGTTDTRIESLHKTTNFGTDTFLSVKSSASSLLRWSVTAIPSNATVVDACIELVVDDPSVRAFSAFAVKRDWTETGATWNNATTLVPWGLPGANDTTDRDNTPVASFVKTTSGPVLMLLSVSLAQQWVANNSANKGIIVTNAAANDGISFESSESIDPASRPILRVLYTLP